MTPVLIDTHCHLDAGEFASDRDAVIARAQQTGVGVIVIPSVEHANFGVVAALAQSFPGGAYALGIHPMYVPRARDEDLVYLEGCIQAALTDPRFVAIGEIGLDFFVAELKTPEMAARQEHFYRVQLELAAHYGLPVLLHVRRSQDVLLKHLRQCQTVGGIAHAFNGSFQQAHQFIERGFALGFGGAMTFPRARQIRRLAEQLPLEALVLETDAPDLAPAWLGAGSSSARVRNEPAELAGISRELARLRGVDSAFLADMTARNARRALPRLKDAPGARPS